MPDRIAVRVGADTREVDSYSGNVLSGNSVFVVSVPVGVDALLVITADGRDQSISLRTGTPGSDSAATSRLPTAAPS